MEKRRKAKNIRLFKLKIHSWVCYSMGSESQQSSVWLKHKRTNSHQLASTRRDGGEEKRRHPSHYHWNKCSSCQWNIYVPLLGEHLAFFLHVLCSLAVCWCAVFLCCTVDCCVERKKFFGNTKFDLLLSRDLTAKPLFVER